MISQFCDPRGNSHTLPLKMTAGFVFPWSERGGLRGREGERNKYIYIYKKGKKKGREGGKMGCRI